MIITIILFIGSLCIYIKCDKYIKKLNKLSNEDYTGCEIPLEMLITVENQVTLTEVVLFKYVSIFCMVTNLFILIWRMIECI